MSLWKTIVMTQTITCYDVHCFTQLENKLLNEIRELTMTDISCELLLYGSTGIELSKRVFDAVHRFIDESDSL